MVLAAVSATLLPPMTFPGAWTIPQAVARFAMMFVAGALLNQFRNVIPARWSLVAVSVVIVAASSLLPDYRVVGAIPLAYAIIVSGSLVHNKRLRLRTDLSYGVYIYAFPMQQLLIVCGLAASESARVLSRCDDRHPAAGRAELVPGGKARPVLKLDSAKTVCLQRRRAMTKPPAVTGRLWPTADRTSSR